MYVLNNKFNLYRRPCEKSFFNRNDGDETVRFVRQLNCIITVIDISRLLLHSYPNNLTLCSALVVRTNIFQQYASSGL